MAGKERQVFIRFQSPQGKVTITFQPGEADTASHEQLKEWAKERADPSGRRKIVECRVVK